MDHDDIFRYVFIVQLIFQHEVFQQQHMVLPSFSAAFGQVDCALVPLPLDWDSRATTEKRFRAVRRAVFGLI